MQVVRNILDGADEVAFSPHGDSRGRLVAIEGEGDVCFPIRRVYYISGVPADAVRGRHAHLDLRQVLLCVKGSCTVDLDNGMEKASVRLSEEEDGVYIHGLVWREMRDFSPDCVLMALVDRKYDRDDYIFDYGRFRCLAAAGG